MFKFNESCNAIYFIISFYNLNKLCIVIPSYHFFLPGNYSRNSNVLFLFRSKLIKATFFFFEITLHLGEFQSAAIGKIKIIKIEPEPKSIVPHLNHCPSFMSIISIEHMLIRLEVNFSQKYKFICNY